MCLGAWYGKMARRYFLCLPQKNEEDQLLQAIWMAEFGEEARLVEVLKRLLERKLVIARLAIDRCQFEEGELPKNGYSPDEDEPRK
jgi:hypothetical protein